MTNVGTRMVTAALAAFALWALLFLVAGLFGFGGKVGVHPDDPSAIKPLPSLELSEAESKLQDIDAYAAVADRPLFNHDRKPLPEQNVASNQPPPPPPPQPLEVELTSVLLVNKQKIAIVQNKKDRKSQSVHVGKSLTGDLSSWKLVELKGREAVFEGPNGKETLELRVFNGKGGKPPTAMPKRPAPQPKPTGNVPAPAVAAQPPPPPPPSKGIEQKQEPAPAQPMTPEERAELIRQRIAERRRQMREEAERANQEQNGE